MTSSETELRVGSTFLFVNKGLLLLLGLVVVTSGCIDSVEPMSEVSDSPEDYVDEEVTIQGEVRDTSGMEEVAMLEEPQDVSEEVAEVHRSSVVIGNVDGQIDFKGCEPSEFASEVKVRGSIESYETCDCQPQNIEETLEEEKQFVANHSNQIDSPEEVELQYNEEHFETSTFVSACEQGTNETQTVISEGTGINPQPVIQYQGCIEDTTETHHYFSCTEIVEEYD